ncbi:MAG: trigger factor [Lachnospiraceae bacterium]|nr:trigger factor [Lachnospiraceae bacterium]
MDKENELLTGTDIDTAETVTDTTESVTEAVENVAAVTVEEAVETSATSETPDTAPKTKDNNAPAQGNKTLFGVVIALGIVIVALLVLFIVLLLNRDEKDKNPTPADTDAGNNQTVTVEADPIDIEGDGEGTAVLPTEAIAPKEFSVSVKLGTYKGLTAEFEVPPVTDEDIENELKYFLSTVPQKSPVTDREVQEGDFVLIDFVGTLDGEVFDGGSATGYELEIGSHTFIDGFESGLIGKKQGDSVSLDLTFPETYGNADLAGKPVNFLVNVNEIYTYVTPELTDELVAANTSFASIEEYKQAAREEFAKYNEEYADSMAKDDIIKQVIDSSEFTGEIAEEIAYEEESALQYYDLIMQQYYGIDGLTYFQYTYGFTEEEYKLFIHEQSEFQVKYVHILDEIVKAEGLSLTEEEKSDNENEDLETIRQKAENIIFDNATINKITK